MHYYQHHIGDFIKDTSFLTNEEVGIYLKLIWLYYDTELPLSNNMFELTMKTSARDSEELVKGILAMFFILSDDSKFWHHSRCDKEISNYKSLIDIASKAGKASALKRSLNRNSTDVKQALNSSSTDVQLTINHEPLTINHKPNINTIQSGAKLLTCPHLEILKLYQKHLPHLTQPRVWEGARQSNLKNRWIQASQKSDFSDGYTTLEGGLVWWDEFFQYIAKDTKLFSGFESNNRTWRPDLVWIVNASNFQKIIDGKYNK